MSSLARLEVALFMAIAAGFPATFLNDAYYINARTLSVCLSE